jgi:8-oxo-dGTP pyrophosphatase MutT (NUDIX family)
MATEGFMNKNNNDEKLIWTESNRKTVFNSAIFSISAVKSMSPQGKDGLFSVMESNEWAVVIPVIKTEKGNEFVMVRQWRHGLKKISVEFPGGVIEKGEDIAEGAKRELREETAFTANKFTLLASMSPNPAIMSNAVHFFLAEDLVSIGEQDLDKDEFIEIETHPVDEVIKNMGTPPYVHSLMAAALFFFKQKYNTVK